MRTSRTTSTPRTPGGPSWGWARSRRRDDAAAGRRASWPTTNPNWTTWTTPTLPLLAQQARQPQSLTPTLPLARHLSIVQAHVAQMTVANLTPSAGALPQQQPAGVTRPQSQGGLLPEQESPEEQERRQRGAQGQSWGQYTKAAGREATSFAASLVPARPTMQSFSGSLQAGANLAGTALAALGPVGAAAGLGLKAAGSAVSAFTANVESFIERAQELKSFSGEIAGADARARVRDTLNKINEAKQLGTEYAQLVEAKTKLQKEWSEATMGAKRERLKFQENVVGGFGEILKFFNQGGGGLAGAVKQGVKEGMKEAKEEDLGKEFADEQLAALRATVVFPGPRNPEVRDPQEAARRRAGRPPLREPPRFPGL